MKMMLGVRHPLPLAVIVVSLYSLIYFAGTIALKVPESKAVLRKVFFR
jgi:hypothetical protein